MTISSPGSSQSEQDDATPSAETGPIADLTTEGNSESISITDRIKNALLEAYQEAEAIIAGDRTNDLQDRLGEWTYQALAELGSIKHAARGVALTLFIYKKAVIAQDIRAHKAEHAGGFSARRIDTAVTVPFLIEKTLPRNVESHWLSQTFSFAGPFHRGSVLSTQPKRAGTLFIELVNIVQEENSEQFAQAAVVAILEQLVRIRNNERVILTRPKDLSVERTVNLIERHLGISYRHNAPRLPQLVIYAAYQRLVQTVGRYSGMTLERLERMKSADRKSGTVGDIVVTQDGAAIEAVEVKFNQNVAFIHVAEAIDKVRAEAVRRYYILSTQGIAPEDEAAIEKRRKEFLAQNGCEIIINGVLDTLAYYLRLLPTTTEFIFAYADLLENDPDTDYEHRIAWNECCQSG